MARRINGSPEPQDESATPKRKLVKPEDVQVISRKGGKGSEGVFPGPRQTAALRRQKEIARTPNVNLPEDRLDALTPKQRQLWRTMGMDDIQPEGEQTPEQAENIAVDSFLYACSLSDVEPAEETVRAILRRRQAP